ncbi:hypothetical protein KY084_12995 [Stakelama sp. CBK3Z-3]|uniref:Twin-arginine translocation signal domain-containing protein n=2 Tax=Stakelama flava TaxID=2860338 RepID=A0ABS6XNK0_9SPHN|nr:hypothetical protein [Stakelama flava]
MHHRHDTDRAGLSRRAFLGCTACVAGVAGMGIAPDALAAVAKGREVYREFPYGAVTLTGGPIKRQFDAIHAHYLALDMTSFSRCFAARRFACAGPDMGGLYNADGFVPSLTFGRYVSGLSRLCAATGDQRCCRKSSTSLPLYLARIEGPDRQEASALCHF